MSRVLAIFLDGYEHSLAQQFMAAGEMPAMSRIAASSAYFALHYGSAQATGLAGEHVATGLSPDDARRWSAVHFDPRSYAVWQEGTRLRPFVADLNCRTVVFDPPYFNLSAAPSARGLVSWGAHDPGVAACSRPSDLTQEINRRFGAYPAARWIYGFAWPSHEKSLNMGFDLARAVDVRADAAHWLLSERCPDWDLALVAVSEPHSVIEALWHGVDVEHRLHQLPSAAPAGWGIHAVYRAVDRLIGKLTAAFPEALPLVFALGGMGPNRSDVPSMLLLPELMYRNAFGTAYFRQPTEWNFDASPGPLLPPEMPSWEQRIAAQFPPAAAAKWRAAAQRLRASAAAAVPWRIRKCLHRIMSRDESSAAVARVSLDWMPASAYRRFWPSMPAFALPSFYDGRVRLNLIGRERFGMVPHADYSRVLEEIESLVRECIDSSTGDTVVAAVEHPKVRDPRDLHATQADLIVVWNGATTCLEHPRLGRIGPVPHRRTGGHTGRFGMAYLRGADGVAAGDHGIRSSFDVVPTILDLLGARPRGLISGVSLLATASSEGPSGTPAYAPAAAR